MNLDDDLAAKLRGLARRQGGSLDDALNTIIRRGLTSVSSGDRSAKAFRLETFRRTFRPGVDPLMLNQLANEVDDRDAKS